MDSLESTIVQAVIGGMFSLAGIWLTHTLQSQQSTINVGRVVRDVGIIVLLQAGAGFVVGATHSNPYSREYRVAAIFEQFELGEGTDAVSNPYSDEFMVAIAFASIVASVIGFTISGSRVGANKWGHLLAVAVGVWLVSFSNVLLDLVSVSEWVAAIVAILFTMAAGGGLSYLFSRK